MKTKMKTVIWGLALAAGLMVAMPAANAQEGDGGQKPRKERREGAGRPGMNLERLKEALELTDEQVAKLKPIFAAEREELAAKRKELGPDADRAAQREAMQAIREKYRTQIDAVLTPEQREKIAKLRERRGPGGPAEGRKGKGKGGDDMPPPPPPEI